MKLLLIFIVFIHCQYTHAKKILVIDSYSAAFPWTASYHKGLESLLQEKNQLQYFEMDTKRVPKHQFQQKADQAWAKYLELAPDLVILGDDNALKYLGPRFAQTKTPTFYLGINGNPRAYLGKDAHKLTGTLERPNFLRSINMLKNVFPSFKKVLVIFDNSPTSHIIYEQNIKNNLDQLHSKDHKVDVKIIKSWQSWQEAVVTSSLNYDVIFFTLFHAVKDLSGQHIDGNKVLEWSSKHSPIPIGSFTSFAIGNNKAFGGYVSDGFFEGQYLAKIIQTHLQGKPISDFPVMVAPRKYIFSKSLLKRYNLKLPSSEKIKEEVMLVD